LSRNFWQIEYIGNSLPDYFLGSIQFINHPPPFLVRLPRGFYGVKMGDPKGGGGKAA
jgi:hypothetical protein